MTEKSKFTYTNSTLKFSIAGFFIPGFTAIILLGFQVGLTYLGLECTMAWKVIWTITLIGTIVAPILFVKLMNKTMMTGFHLTSKETTFFNLIEYTFIQCTLAFPIFTGPSLCYGRGGQNGLEFVFTAWAAIPILILIALSFDHLKKRKLKELISQYNK
jgi:hypothetical protein